MKKLAVLVTQENAKALLDWHFSRDGLAPDHSKEELILYYGSFEEVVEQFIEDRVVITSDTYFDDSGYALYGDVFVERGEYEIASYPEFRTQVIGILTIDSPAECFIEPSRFAQFCIQKAITTNPAIQTIALRLLEAAEHGQLSVRIGDESVLKEFEIGTKTSSRRMSVLAGLDFLGLDCLYGNDNFIIVKTKRIGGKND